jgi:ferritin-like metal-binding protein YciE
MNWIPDRHAPHLRQVFHAIATHLLSLEKLTAVYSEQLLSALGEFPEEGAKIAKFLAQSQQQVVRLSKLIIDGGSCAGSSTAAIPTPVSEGPEWASLNASFALAGLKSYEVSAYRYLLITCELANLDSARPDLEANLAEVESMVDWLGRNSEILAVRHLQSVGVLSASRASI